MEIYRIIDTPGHKFYLYYETEIEKYRCETFLAKEPETIAWIETEVGKGRIFLDIGANIGVYAIYAALLHPDIQVYAFEPMLKNYDRLRQNIALNKLSNISAFPIAFSKENGLQQFFVNNPETGTSGSQIGDNIGDNGKHFEAVAEYKALTMSVDTFCYSFLGEYPTHIKIDVDGKEGLIIDGMEETLTEVDSMLIEFNSQDIKHKEKITEAGFTWRNRYNVGKDNSRFRRERDGIKARNIIYTRG